MKVFEVFIAALLTVYIGKDQKDFWTWAICFVSMGRALKVLQNMN